MNISEVDKNFAVQSSIEKDDICWVNANSKPFVIKGVYYDGKRYKRMDSDVARSVSEGVSYLHTHTSGGRVLFETDSYYVAVSARGHSDHMPHMPYTGSKGFDIYLFENGEFIYYKTFIPSTDKCDEFENIVEFESRQRRKILIHFPLYGNVDELNIGLQNDAFVDSFDPYKKGELAIYYGSSITQGGCASRPGNNFPAIVSRKTMTDFRCLGFSGNAHGEDEMIEYLANQEMTLFVMDYSHNDLYEPDKLAIRHPKLYKAVREKYPDMPIIIMSAPWSKCVEQAKEKGRKVVYSTYEQAKKNGDNVYFVDGFEFFGSEYADCATVDGTHPNDFGFVKMADAVLKVIKDNKLM